MKSILSYLMIGVLLNLVFSVLQNLINPLVSGWEANILNYTISILFILAWFIFGLIPGYFKSKRFIFFTIFFWLIPVIPIVVFYFAGIGNKNFSILDSFLKVLAILYTSYEIPTIGFNYIKEDNNIFYLIFIVCALPLIYSILGYLFTYILKSIRVTLKKDVSHLGPIDENNDLGDGIINEE